MVEEPIRLELLDSARAQKRNPDTNPHTIPPACLSVCLFIVHAYIHTLITPHPHDVHPAIGGEIWS